MPASLTARIEVFRPGTFVPMQGGTITYSAADLKAVADSYDPEVAPAPVVVGHPKEDAPAFGWVESFEYDAAAERLVANLHDIDPAFAEAVRAGRYRKVSMSFFSPNQPHNPVPGAWYPKHVGFLGAAPPAVSGLRNASFAGEAGATFTAAFGAGAQSASIFRRLRDWMIERDGVEAADKVLPAWEIEWLNEADVAPPPFPGAFAAPADPAAQTDPQTNQNEDPVTNPPVISPPDPSLAAREAEIAAREARIAAREAEIAHADHAAFAERLVAEGRLLPASRDQVVAILDAAPGHAAVSFAGEGDPISLGAALRQVLEAQPKVVSFGAMEIGREPGQQGQVAFAADGRAVDPSSLQIHNSALEYQRTHPGTAYLDAVRAVS